MTAQEKRQANRIIRNARELERDVFDLVAELQEAMNDGADPFDWESAHQHLHNAQSRLPLLFDLVINIKREVAV